MWLKAKAQNKLVYSWNNALVNLDLSITDETHGTVNGHGSYQAGSRPIEIDPSEVGAIQDAPMDEAKAYALVKAFNQLWGYQVL